MKRAFAGVSVLFALIAFMIVLSWRGSSSAPGVDGDIGTPNILHAQSELTALEDAGNPNHESGSHLSPEPSPKSEVQKLSSKFVGQPPGSYPIRIGDAVARLLNPHIRPSRIPGTSSAEMHSRLEREPKDEPWASEMEYQIRTFLQPLSVSYKFSIDLIECRTSMCEIQATWLGLTFNGGKWIAFVEKLKDQAWAEAIADSRIGFVSTEKSLGVAGTGIVTVLIRDSTAK